MQQNKNILLTGTAGFIGSNFVPYFLEKYPEYNLINLDLLTYAGTLDNLKECEQNLRYKFIKGDICNRELVEFIFSEYDITGVIHFAAESHVDNSIKNPGVFIRTNVNGTFTLIDVAYKYWMNKPFEYKINYENSDFIIYQLMKCMELLILIQMIYLQKLHHMLQTLHIVLQKHLAI